jgi:hypothetical protein
MVTVSNYVQRESKDGKKFFALILTGGMELVLSEASGRYYATAKSTSIPSTFPESICKDLVGTKLPGKVTRVDCEPFEYTVQESGEVIIVNHRWVYSPSEAHLEETVYEKEPIGAVSEF